MAIPAREQLPKNIINVLYKKTYQRVIVIFYELLRHHMQFKSAFDVSQDKAIPPIIDLTQESQEVRTTVINKLDEGRKSIQNVLSSLENLFSKERLSSDSKRNLLSIINYVKQAYISLRLTINCEKYIEVVNQYLVSPHAKEDFSINTWLNSMADTFESELRKNKIILKKEGLLLESTEYHINGHKAVLLYAFVNIFKNAIKFTAAKKIPGEITINLQHHPMNGFCLSVTDSGLGMTPEEMTKCFGEQLNKSIQGSGSGLRHIQTSLAQVQGKIVVESQKDIGSMFSITLPMTIIAIQPTEPSLVDTMPNLMPATASSLAAPSSFLSPLAYNSPQELFPQDVEISLEQQKIIAHEGRNVRQAAVGSLTGSIREMAKAILKLEAILSKMPSSPTQSTLQSYFGLMKHILKEQNTALNLEKFHDIIENRLLSPYAKEHFSINTWIHSMTDMVQSELTFDQITLIKAGLLKNQVEFVVNGHKALLLFAFVKILKSAIESSSLQQTNTEITVTLEQEKDTFCLSVTENSTNSTEQLEAHFMPIIQSLAVAKGQLTVMSNKENNTSTISLRLPFELIKTVDRQINYAAIRILVVDDNSTSLRTAKHTLLHMGFLDMNIALADSSKTAMEFFDQAQFFDVVLTDMNMPGGDGLALAAAIREHQQKIPPPAKTKIIILSGNSVQDLDIQQSIHLIDDILVKPLLPESLHTAFIKLYGTIIVAPRSGSQEGKASLLSLPPTPLEPFISLSPSKPSAACITEPLSLTALRPLPLLSLTSTESSGCGFFSKPSPAHSDYRDLPVSPRSAGPRSTPSPQNQDADPTNTALGNH